MTSAMSIPSTPSRALSMALLPESERRRLIGSLTRSEAEALLFDWRFWARPTQLAPAGDWQVWLILAGRGFGKTRTGAEWVKAQVASGQAGRVALVGETAADVRDVMVEGESGLLAISSPRFRPKYEPSKRRLTWPNGAMATTYSADDPEQLRGPQHDAAWTDELAKWRYAQEAWDNLMLGLRLGERPQVVATTTPRPIKLIKALLADESVAVTRGATYDNLVNLAPTFRRKVVARYEGTRLGRQELYAELMEDVPGALWSQEMIEAARVTAAPTLTRVVVAIDPAVTSGENADETGIVVMGVDKDGQGYVLADLTCRASPEAWARRAIGAYDRYEADVIVAETNNGGELVRSVLTAAARTAERPMPAYKAVHASRGKRTRAEPVSLLYEGGKVHHVGMFPALEDQMRTFVPDQDDGSPDRVDALVWAATELMVYTTERSRTRRAA